MACCLRSRSFCLAAVDCLIDRWRRIDRLAIRPHQLVPAFAEQLVGLLDQRRPAKAGRRPPATLLQLAWQPRHPHPENKDVV
jgi:hypothetical protein